MIATGLIVVVANGDIGSEGDGGSGSGGGGGGDGSGGAACLDTSRKFHRETAVRAECENARRRERGPGRKLGVSGKRAEGAGQSLERESGGQQRDAVARFSSPVPAKRPTGLERARTTVAHSRATRGLACYTLFLYIVHT